MQRYEDSEFRARVDAAMTRVRAVLDATRNPQHPADVPHRYDDKYLLADFLARTSMAAMVQCLEVIGLSAEALAQLREWAKSRSVTLRLKAQEDCTYLREETRKVESAQAQVTETRGILGTTKKTEKIVTTVTEHFFRFDLRYELVAFQGATDEQGLSLHARAAHIEIKTPTKTTPRPRTVVRPHVDVDLSWLLRRLDGESRVSFAIDREDPSCHTPRRNRQVDDVLYGFATLHAWCARVWAYFVNEVFPVQQEHGLDLSAIDDREIFVPALPLFEGDGFGPPSQGDGLLPAEYATAFLAEQARSLSEKCRSLAKVFPRNDTVITVVEAALLTTLRHAQRVCQQYADGVDSIEQMLRDQLVAAIGKELSPADFAGYMDFHHRKLVKPEFHPHPFSHAIRRPDHSPEGVLGIEATRGRSMPDPISTTVAASRAVRPMSFPLDAAVNVSFLGDRYLHAWIGHQFSGASGLALHLVARARQFSSFVLLVGRIASADVFEPRFGIIVQNKDLLKIPLMLEAIPTPKEFRDAIESLSPEQQRFAKAFRGMQLESTLFGVCVIQIKPQLEKLLKLAPDSLTKEIKLTQELLSLFIEYQIPSDLLSYDGADDAPASEKLARVKDYVVRMQEMITISRQREIDEARERESFRLAEANRTPVALPPSMPMGGPPPPMSAPSFAGPMPGAPHGGRPPPSPGMSGGPPMGPPPTARMAAVAPAVAAPPAPAPGPSPAPASVAASTSAPEPSRSPPRAETHAAASSRGTASATDALDYTRLPGEIDAKLEALDDDSALRPTIINPGDVWTRTAQKGLLAAPETTTLSAKEQKDEKARAFDLLDALSRSGALPIEDASLHVVLAATHCFDKTLLDTVIQGNVNPIEKVERSLMIVASTIHRRPAVELLADDQRSRFLTYSPRLGPPPAGDAPPQDPSSGRGDV
ncbi:MAG: hypothetical protein IT379_12740 [Deltaproteobacteria bacterium]|nr:hypothetical protein [Deltaproteobacteria bacterium]